MSRLQTLPAPEREPDAGLSITVRAELLDRLVEAVAEKVLERLEREGRAEPTPGWLDVAGAATYLSVSPERVRKLAAAGKLRYAQEGPGCRILFRKADLDATMEAWTT